MPTDAGRVVACGFRVLALGAVAIVSGCPVAHFELNDGGGLDGSSDASGDVRFTDGDVHAPGVDAHMADADAHATDADAHATDADVVDASICPTGEQVCSGLCVSTASDTQNCGACGQTCVNAVACTNGTCTCAPPDALCGLKCVDTTADGSNCGRCGTVCPTGQFCSGSVCTVACAAGMMSCGNSCVNTQTDPNNCGACGAACNLPNATAGCSGGHCTVAACATGYMDCNTTPTDGCEINTAANPANCGTCGMVCPTNNATAICTSGSCTVVCTTGFADCDHVLSNACEVNTTNNLTDCGGCGIPCALPNAVPTCMDSMCQVASCTGTFMHCAGQPQSGGCETDTNNDLQNCGACGAACTVPANESVACSGGHCGTGSCISPYLNCNGNLSTGCTVDSANDSNNCGSCGRKCMNGMVCISSGCNCPAGTENCGGTCVTTSTDSNNCGSCGNRCTNGGTCLNGTCGCATATLTYCTPDGCVNTQTDNTHCGNCTTTCNGGHQCAAGRCP